jgi:hypothetical protein
MSFEKTGRVGLGDNAQPDTDERPIPPAPSIPSVEQEEENADS